MKVDQEIEVDLVLGIESRKEGVIIVGNKDILLGSVKNSKRLKINKKSRRHRCTKYPK